MEQVLSILNVNNLKRKAKEHKMKLVIDIGGTSIKYTLCENGVLSEIKQVSSPKYWKER